MENTKESFYGQHEEEKILYTDTGHPIGKWLGLAKLYLGCLVIWLIGVIISSQLTLVSLPTGTISFAVALTIAVVGTLAQGKMEQSNRFYITDRRIVRFTAPTPFATTTRALTWDQAAKVKTFPPNILYKSLMIGTVIVHSKSTIISGNTPLSENVAVNDDLELENIFYYKDLGNYLDKIMYLYNREPEKLAQLRPFIPKPKGMRY